MTLHAPRFSLFALSLLPLFGKKEVFFLLFVGQTLCFSPYCLESIDKCKKIWYNVLVVDATIWKSIQKSCFYLYFLCITNN